MYILAIVAAVCVETHMDWSGSTDSCAAGSASIAMPRRLASLRWIFRSVFLPSSVDF
jgi:hypothetical protein